MPRSVLVSLAFALSVLAGSASAAEDGGVAAELRAFRVERGANGEETLSPAREIRPGDLVEYEAIYRNTGSGRVNGLSPVLPVPLGLEYVPESAKPAAVEATTDGASWGPAPLRRKQVLSDGHEAWIEVPPAEYRSLRWSIGDLGPEASATVRARMRVTPLPAVSAAPGDKR